MAHALALGLLLLASCAAPPPKGPRLRIRADPAYLERLPLSMDTIVRRLREEKIEILRQEGSEAEVRGVEPEALSHLVLQTRDGVPIYLRDVAVIDAR